VHQVADFPVSRWSWIDGTSQGPKCRHCQGTFPAAVTEEENVLIFETTESIKMKEALTYQNHHLYSILAIKPDHDCSVDMLLSP
jgi:hypothetical protein